MRALTDPVNTGAVTIALPQDVQAEAWDWPVELFDRRVWHVAMTSPETAVLRQAASAIRASARPLIVAGGGVAYSEARRRYVSSPRRPASPSLRLRRVRAPWRGTTRRRWVRSG
jgi:3D-(3,5/4)-trihydroxycyclohexane-1,2-dione acylhydrolase (decyclizing)